jgi:hypothetical protein
MRNRSLASESGSSHDDTDGELSRIWFATAFPGWSLEQVRNAARKAIRRDRTPATFQALLR